MASANSRSTRESLPTSQSSLNNALSPEERQHSTDQRDHSPSNRSHGDDPEAFKDPQEKPSAYLSEQLSLAREIVFVFIVCMAQLFAQAGLSQTLIIIHVIGDSFGITNDGELSWLIAGYSLTVGTFILFSGRLGDLFGYKNMLIIGLSWFSLWTMVTGVSVYSSPVLFIFGRVFQGIGTAICLPQALAILGSTYAPGRRKAIVFCLFGATAPLGAFLGGLFSSLFAMAWWPWTFWTCAIILFLLAITAHFVIPATPQTKSSSTPLSEKIKQLDLPAATVGITGLVLFNFAWNQAPVVGWQEPYIYVLLIVGILLLGAFFFLELRSSNPLIPFHALTSDVSFVLGAVACGWACFGIWVYYMIQIFEEARGLSPLHSAANLVPLALSGMIAAGTTPIVLHRLGPAVVMSIALLAFTVGTVLLATAPVHQSYWYQTFWSLIVISFGMDMSFPASTLILSDAVEREYQGIAASLITTIINYSISLGLGFAGTVEIEVNDGGTTAAEVLKGYRGAFYMAIGLAGFGVFICLCFLAKSYLKPSKSDSQNKDSEGNST